MNSSDQLQPPCVFISYSHDSSDHKAWVRELASRLRQVGIDVLLDVWELGAGDDVPKFMEHSVRKAIRVIMVCTEQYVRKADDGKGGAGYEAMVVTGELVTDLGTRKFIPVVRQSSSPVVLPACVSTRLYVDFCRDDLFEEKLEELAREIHAAPAIEKPALGKNPFNARGSGPSPLLADQDETANVVRAPHDIYKLGIGHANSSDFPKWRALVHHEKQQALEGMRHWREVSSNSIPKLKTELPEYVFPGIDANAGIFAIAFAGFDSNDARFHNQLALLDWFQNPVGWNQSGYTIVNGVPKLALFAFQALWGALALSRQKPEFAYKLAMTPLADHRGDSDSRPLFKCYWAMGWPESMDEDCTVAWTFLNFLIEKWEWLWKLFGTKDDTQAAIVAYYSFLNTLDFVSAVKALRTSDQMREPIVPLCFWFSSDEVRRQSAHLLSGIAPFLIDLFSENEIPMTELPELWNQWMHQSTKWVAGAYRQSMSRMHAGYGIPHYDLPKMIRPESHKRVID